MYEIDFYEDEQAYNNFEEFLNELLDSNEKSKQSQLKKIRYQMHLLEQLGPQLREPQVKELRGYKHKLFEMRPMPERIFFVFWDEDRYVILSHYQKRQNKTDPKEINKALKRLDNWLKRKEKD